MCAYYFGNTFVYPKETARPLSDVSARKLSFSVCCTPLCFEHLLTAETALGTIPLFISSSVFPSHLPRSKHNPIASKCFAFPFKFYDFAYDGNGYGFLVIIHLLEIGMQEQSKKKKNPENTVQQRKNVCLINARCLVLSVEVTLLPIQREKMLIGMVVCFPL